MAVFGKEYHLLLAVSVSQSVNQSVSQSVSQSVIHQVLNASHGLFKRKILIEK